MEPGPWLLDTNIVSELRKGRRCQPSVMAWSETVPPSACFLSNVTIAEIRFGIARVGDNLFRAELESWLQNGVRTWFGRRILDISEDVLVAWRELSWDGQKSNYTYSQPDALIAATARVHGLTVVTRNTAGFERAGVPLFNPWLD